MSERWPRLDDQLCFALYRASRAVTRAYGPLLEPLGLTYPQYVAMLALWEGDALSVKALGERLALDSATITPLLKRLEQQGLVEKRRDPADERVVRVKLTEEGRALQLRARTLPEELACRFGDVQDPALREQLRGLREQLVGLADALEQSEEGA